MKVLKQVLGVDVAQKELVVTLGRLNEDLSADLYLHKVFRNKETGFSALLKWLKKNTDEAVPLQVVMEATGVYHQKFAYYLVENQISVCIVLPNKISSYMRTLDTKTVTDKTCSEAIVQFGLGRKLDNWKKPNNLYKVMQQLTRERDQLVQERSAIKNQIHAEKSEAEPNNNSIKRFNARIKFINDQEKEIKKEINELVNSDQTVKKQIENIQTIPGIGQLTAVTILAETNGFELIRNKKQLTSYAGFDVKEKQSGTSVKGKPKISKRGNKHLRKCMHLPSLSAVKHIEVYKELYTRIVSKSGIKMKGLIAVQRKMLELAYVLHKNNTVFEHGYEVKKRVLLLEEDTLTS
jgi:transposase